MLIKFKKQLGNMNMTSKYRWSHYDTITVYSFLSTYLSIKFLRILNVIGTPNFAYKIALTRLVWYIKWRLKDVGFSAPQSYM